jgi:hypothetical protein
MYTMESFISGEIANWIEGRKREKKKEVTKDTAGKSSIEKTNNKRETYFNCSIKLRVLAC